MEIKYVLYLLLVGLVVSLFFNFRGCSKGNVVDPAYQRQVDSLSFVNRGLSEDVKARMVEVDSLNRRVSVLNSDLSVARKEAADAKEEVRRTKAVLADTDRKLAKLRASKVDLSDEQLDGYLDGYFGRPKK